MAVTSINKLQAGIKSQANIIMDKNSTHAMKEDLKFQY